MEVGTVIPRTRLRRALRRTWADAVSRPAEPVLLSVVLTALVLPGYLVRYGTAPRWGLLVTLAAVPAFLVLFVKIAAGPDHGLDRWDMAWVTARLTAYIILAAVLTAGIGWLVSRASGLVPASAMPALPGSDAPIIFRAVGSAMLRPSTWVSTGIMVALFMGAHLLPVTSGLREALRTSARWVVHRPLEVAAVIVATVLLAYTPIVLATAPFLVLPSPVITIAGAAVPLGLVPVLVGAAVGGVLSVRFPAAYRTAPDG